PYRAHRDLHPFPTRRSSDLLSSQKFKEIIEGKRTFPSPSERDMAMANICAINGWTDQEIADLLLGQRKISGDDLKHPLYYQLTRSEEHTSELQSRENLVCRL